MEQRQRNRGGDGAVAGPDVVLPLVVGRDRDRTTRHAHGVAADRMSRGEGCRRRREELEVTRGLADERGQLPEHGGGIAGQVVVLHDLDRPTAPDRLDHEVASEPAGRGVGGAELRHELDVVAVGCRLRPLPRVHDRTRIADDLRHAHVDTRNEPERDRFDREPRRVDDDACARDLRNAAVHRRGRGHVPVELFPLRGAHPGSRAATRACAASGRRPLARDRYERSASGSNPRPSSMRSASSRMACQVGHSCTGRPQPHLKFETSPQSHKRFSSPMLKKPGS